MVRDRWLSLKIWAGYRSLDELLEDVVIYIEEDIEDFEAFSVEDDDELEPVRRRWWGIVTIAVSCPVRDMLLALKDELGYRSLDALLGDAADYLEEHIEEFAAAFPVDEEDEE